MGTCSDAGSTSMNEGCRVVGCEASGRMTARRVHGSPTTRGKRGFQPRQTGCNREVQQTLFRCGQQAATRLGFGQGTPHRGTTLNVARTWTITCEEHHVTATKFGTGNITSSRDRLTWLDATRNGLQQGTLHLRKRAQFGAITRRSRVDNV